MNSHLRVFNRRYLGSAVLARHATLSDVPGPFPFPIIGAMPHYLPIVGKYDPTRAYKTFLLKYKEFGPIVKERMFGTTMVFLYDPNDIEAIIRTKAGEWPKRITHLILEYVRKYELAEVHNDGGIFMANGIEWVNLRQNFQKSMTIDEVSKFIPRIDDLASDITSKMLKTSSMNHHIKTDFLNVLLAYATDYMGLTFFGKSWDSVDNILNPKTPSYRLIHASTQINHATGPTDHGSQLWRLFSTPLYKQILECVKMLDSVVLEEMKDRIKDKKFTPKEEYNYLDVWMQTGKKDYKELLTFVSDSILAGIDTMAYTMSFVIYHLSVNPEVQEKLYKELLALDPDMKRSLNVELLSETSYLKKCVKEALRLNPLSLGIGRILTEDKVLSGYLIPAETQMVTINQVTSRLPEYVPYPHEFIPERYDSNSKFKKMHPYVTLPFSHGPRACLGRRLAEQGMYIFLFKLFRNYRVDWIGPRPLDCLTSLINYPDAPLLFKFSKRNK